MRLQACVPPRNRLARPRSRAAGTTLAALALLTLLALPAPAASAAWDQAGGDAAHSGRGAPGALDVQSSFALMPQGMALQPGPAGVLDPARGDGSLLALGRQGNDCRLVLAGPGREPTEASGAIPCALGATLEAFDAPSGLALVCRTGASSDGLLQAWRIDGQEPTWTASPRLETPDPLALPGMGGLQQSAGVWACKGVSVADGLVFVAFSSTEGRNRVEARGLGDGEAVWSSTVPSSILLQQVDPALVPTQAQDASGAFATDGLVATTTGVLVSGRLDGKNVQDAPPGLAWFDRQGTFRGALVRAPVPTDDVAGVSGSTLFPSSAASTANGPLAAHLVGSELFVVDPQNTQGTLTELGNPSLGQRVLAAPCWSRDTLLVPGESSAFILAATDPASARTWPGFGNGRLQACLVGDSGEAWATVRRNDNGTKVDAVRIQLGTGRTLARLPLPLQAGDPAALGTRLLAIPGGLVAWDESGSAALLGPDPAGDVPALAIDDPYATVGAPATLTVPASTATTRHLLAWGDGFLEEVPTAERAGPDAALDDGRLQLSHVYDQAGTRAVTLTAVFEDGRTASSRGDMLVGTPAPPPRGLIEILFDPENQNYTFTALGFLVSGIAAILGIVGVARGRRRLDHHLRDLERIRDDGRRDPFQAIRDLHTFREGERKALAKGHLEDAQYTVVEASAVQVLEILRSRILGTFVGRVTERFSHALDIALSDGSIDEVEGAGLIAMAEAEPDLKPLERSRLADLVRSWQRVI